MPTLNPRINVTLPPSLDLLVSRMASQTRSSKSQVVRELLEAAQPALQRAVALMEAASQAAGSVKASFAKSLDLAQAEAESHAASLLGRMDAMSDLVSQAEFIKERRPARKRQRGLGASPAPKDPPPSNRGVRPPETARKPRKSGGLS